MTPNNQKTLEIYSFIAAYKQYHDGISPTFRQIQESCDVSSTSMVNWHLRKLRKLGIVAQNRQFGVMGIELINGLYIPPNYAEVKNKIMAYVGSENRRRKGRRK